MSNPVFAEAINQALVQYDNAHRDDHKWLRAELKNLRCILAAAVDQAGGEIAVSDRSLLGIRDDPELWFVEDTYNRSLRIRTVRPKVCDAEVKGARKTEPLQDWML